MSRVRARIAARTGDGGFTLIEMMVAMIVVFVLLGATFTALKVSSGIVKTSTELHDLNEEGRQAINRMARDLRQATSVVTAVNPDGATFNSTGIVGVRIKADFDVDGCIGGVPLPGTTTACLPYNASNPEDISYCFEPSTHQLYVIDNQVTPAITPLSASSTNCSGGQPLLAGNVGSFKIEYRSNNYRYDLNPTDGVTTWTELDEAGTSVGNNNGQLDVELANIDSLVLNLTMLVDNHPQTYRTQVDLRNAS